MTKQFDLSNRSSTRSLLWSIAAVVVTGGMFAGAGCGDDGKAGEGDDCSVSNDCKSELVCRQSVCVRPDRVDAGSDAGDTGDTEPDGSDSNEPEPEDYFISYVLEKGQDGAGRMRVFNTADGTDVAVSPESIDCSFNCWLSKDMNHFIHARDAGAGAFDVLVAEVGSDLKAEGEGEVLVEEVEDLAVGNGVVTYRKAGDSPSETTFFKPIEGGQEQSVGPVDPTDGDWFVDPEHDLGVLFSVGDSSQTLEMKVGGANSRESDSTYTFGGSNFQEESGSFFGGNVMTEASDDGERLAVAFTGAPNSYQSCNRETRNDPWSTEECDTSNMFKCGEQGRCTRLEVTVHVVDLDRVGELGEQCQFGREGACGPIHECDAPSAQQASEAQCIPSRTVVGVPETNQGPMRETSGCETVEQDTSIRFTSVRGPLSFDQEGNVYLVGERDRSCIRSRFTDVPQNRRDRIGPNSQVVKVDPESGEFEVLEGLPSDELFDPGNCFDEAEGALDITEACKVWVDRARVSPGGDEVAFTATNPNTSSWPKSADFVNLWHMLRDGSEKWFTGDVETNTLDTTTFYLRVHSGQGSGGGQ